MKTLLTLALIVASTPASAGRNVYETSRDEQRAKIKEVTVKGSLEDVVRKIDHFKKFGFSERGIITCRDFYCEQKMERE